MKRLDPLKRLPVLIFLMLVISLGISGYALFQFAITKYSRGDYFYLATRELEFEFPKSWWASTYEFSNESGNVYYIAAYPLATREQWVSVLFIIYDEKFTEAYMERYGLDNVSHALLFEVERTYSDIKKENEGATLNVTGRGIITFSRIEASYITMKVRDGYVDKDGNVHNLTATFIAWIRGTSQGEKIYYIVFYGVEEEWSQPQVQKAFEHMLNTVKISEGKENDESH